MRRIALLPLLLLVGCSPEPVAECEITFGASETIYTSRTAFLEIVFRDAAHRPTRGDGAVTAWVETTAGDRTHARCELHANVEQRQFTDQGQLFVSDSLPAGCAAPVPEGTPPFVAELMFQPAQGAPIQCVGVVSSNLGGAALGDPPLRPASATPPAAPPTPSFPAGTGPSCDRTATMRSCTEFSASYGGMQGSQGMCEAGAGTWRTTPCAREGAMGACEMGGVDRGATIFYYPGDRTPPFPPNDPTEIRVECLAGLEGTFTALTP